jgi:hypothetical protein
MSKRRNVHPDHYKTRGSLRQGEDVVHQEEREKLGRDNAREGAPGPSRKGSRKKSKDEKSDEENQRQ